MPVTLAQNGKTEYKIYLCESPSPSQEFAARELSDFLFAVSGARAEICPFTETPPEKAVLLGINGEAEFCGEDFQIQTEGQTLHLRGSGVRGCLYAVYTLLEDYIGVKFFMPDFTYVPKKQTVVIQDTNRVCRPSFEYRDMVAGDISADTLWCARRRLNGPAQNADPRLGGGLKAFSMGHSFSRFISADEYYGTHPEYFSEVNGTRLRERTQLCLSNPEVFGIVLEKMRSDMRENPDKRIFAFAQDDHPNPCMCESCRELYLREGSHSAAIVAFCSRLCEELEEEFPENKIHTYAYLYSRKPPRRFRVHKNVLLQLCSIECCFERPLTECAENDRRCNAEFVRDLEGWGKICGNILMYDYPCTWHHYLTPSCNLYSQADNLKLYEKNGVTGVFELILTRNHNYGDLLELKAYIISRLLFDTGFDVQSGILDFTERYYGEGGRIIRKYMEYVQSVVLKSGLHQGGNTSPDPQVFTSDVIDRLNDIFDEAEGVCYDAASLERVRKERLPVDYYSAYFYLSQKRENLEEKFLEAADKFGITRIEERVNVREQVFRFSQPEYFKIFGGLSPISADNLKGE